MVDELLILNPHKLSFPDAGLRIMITPHFSPRTRLSMAGRVLISEVRDQHVAHSNVRVLYSRKLPAFLSQRQRLIHSSKNQRDGEAGPGSRHGSTSDSLKRTESCSVENGGKGPAMGDVESGDKPGIEVCQPEEEEEEDGIFSPVRIPGEEDQQQNRSD